MPIAYLRMSGMRLPLDEDETFTDLGYTDNPSRIMRVLNKYYMGQRATSYDPDLLGTFITCINGDIVDHYLFSKRFRKTPRTIFYRMHEELHGADLFDELSQFEGLIAVNDGIHVRLKDIGDEEVRANLAGLFMVRWKGHNVKSVWNEDLPGMEWAVQCYNTLMKKISYQAMRRALR